MNNTIQRENAIFIIGVFVLFLVIPALLFPDFIGNIKDSIIHIAQFLINGIIRIMRFAVNIITHIVHVW